MFLQFEEKKHHQIILAFINKFTFSNFCKGNKCCISSWDLNVLLHVWYIQLNIVNKFVNFYMAMWLAKTGVNVFGELYHIHLEV